MIVHPVNRVGGDDGEGLRRIRQPLMCANMLVRTGWSQLGLLLGEDQQKRQIDLDGAHGLLESCSPRQSSCLADTLFTGNLCGLVRHKCSFTNCE